MNKPYMAQVEHFEDRPKRPTQATLAYPFYNGDTVLVIGEIEQMPGHVAVALSDGRVVFGYHADNFRKLTEDEA